MKVLKFEQCLHISDAECCELVQVFLKIDTGEKFHYIGPLLLRKVLLGRKLLLLFNLKFDRLLLLGLGSIRLIWQSDARHERLRRFLCLLRLNSRWLPFRFIDIVHERLLVAVNLLVLGGWAPHGTFLTRLTGEILTFLIFHLFEFSNLVQLFLHFPRF